MYSKSEFINRSLKSQTHSSLIFYVLLSQMFIRVWTIEQGDCSEEGAVRLDYGGNIDPNKGRLEICANGIWGTVCNDGFGNNDGFDVNAARVVCRQLGVPESALSGVVTNIFCGEGKSNQLIHLDNLRCTGTEMNLLNCTHNGIGIHDCSHSEDIGLICPPSNTCSDEVVRLVDGEDYNATEGRVEYCVGGLWATVCNGTWNNDDVAVVCRQLGLDALEPRTLENVSQVSNLQTPILLDGFDCQSTHKSLGDCGHDFVGERCLHPQDAGAICRGCYESDMRIFQVEEGQKENEGRVEFCSSGRWGLVRYNDWNNNDAKVICRQLGYNVEEDGSAVATVILRQHF